MDDVERFTSGHRTTPRMMPYTAMLSAVPPFLHRRLRRLLGDAAVREPRLIAPDCELLKLHQREGLPGPHYSLQGGYGLRGGARDECKPAPTLALPPADPRSSQ
jgi:hypothetical protein